MVFELRIGMSFAGGIKSAPAPFWTRPLLAGRSASISGWADGLRRMSTAWATRRSLRALRGCGPRAGMACAGREDDQAAICPRLLPAFEPNRAAMGRHAQASNYNKCYATYREFAEVTLQFLRENVPATCENLAIRSRTTSASSIRRIFGFWRERGICQRVANGQPIVAQMFWTILPT